MSMSRCFASTDAMGTRHRHRPKPIRNTAHIVRDRLLLSCFCLLFCRDLYSSRWWCLSRVSFGACQRLSLASAPVLPYSFVVAPSPLHSVPPLDLLALSLCCCPLRLAHSFTLPLHHAILVSPIPSPPTVHQVPLLFCIRLLHYFIRVMSALPPRTNGDTSAQLSCWRLSPW